MPDDNKTERGTARRRNKAREEGQVLRGRDLPGAIAFLGALAGMAFLLRAGIQNWAMLMAALLAQAAQPSPLGVEVLQQTFRVAVLWTLPVVGAAWLASAAASMPNGVVFASRNLLRWNRLNPANNIKGIFSPAGASRILRSILPASAIAYFTYAMVRDHWGDLINTTNATTGSAIATLSRLAMSLAWRAALVMLVWAGVDLALQRQNYERSLRMSRQDIKEENKETIGSPEIKGRIRRLMRQMHRRRMMQEVPKATVVIANPTHVSVALRFDAGTMAAPVVVAKGLDRLALAVRRLAVWHGVPVVENVDLARALYRHVEIGQPIPGRFYASVAEVLAYIYRMQQRKPAVRPAPKVVS